ncbi:RICIN domain-containing protein [Microbacterium gorillae]|uniref:RICIN domain-containing protein n=1 Tax=Microbacterium gorillae TaxID=1231063 RepID=UPI000BBF1EEA|nr:RICIN domain-containing protein [Microbacterium gorillae]
MPRSSRPTPAAAVRPPGRRRLGATAVVIAVLAGTVIAGTAAQAEEPDAPPTPEPSVSATAEPSATATPEPSATEPSVTETTDPTETGSSGQNAVALGPTSILNRLSGRCIDAADAGTTVGTPLQQWQCYAGSGAQTWDVRDAGDGLVSLIMNSTPGVSIAAMDDGTVQLAATAAVAAQQWRPVSTSADVFEFHTAADDGTCLAVVDDSPSDGARLAVAACSGTDGQRFRLVPNVDEDPWKIANPFGPNVTVIDRTWSTPDLQQKVDAIFADQQTSQFGPRRDAVIFTPGSYTADVRVGFNTQILGAGLLPTDVTINGHVRTDASWWDGTGSNLYNSTQNFWRGAENLSVKPTDGQEMWAASQAAPFRRMQVDGDLILAQPNGSGARCGWASGGLLADSVVTGTVDSCTQQQYYTRNSEIGGWTGTNWNLTFQGTTGAPEEGVFDETKYTVVEKTPVVREKPFVYLDGGEFKVFVPALRSDSVGTSWASGTPAGESLGLDAFYITQPGDTAKAINKQLKAGKNLIITPGVYKLDRQLEITRADTVVLGLGLATLQPVKGDAAIEVADVDGVKIAGLIVDAGAKNSDVLVQIGPKKSKKSHAENPTSLHDLFIRVGGNWEAHATQSIVVNSSDVIGDHLWVWRADHGHNAPDGFYPDWKNTTGRNGLVVNGARVTMYGLFVEHYQQYQTLWNGEDGRTFFYQNETPYDAPTQRAWMDGKKNGWAAYKVADSVKHHQAVALGSYAVYFGPNFGAQTFTPDLSNAFETPTGPGISFRHMVTVAITSGTISSIINGVGDVTPEGVKAVTLEQYPQ